MSTSSPNEKKRKSEIEPVHKSSFLESDYPHEDVHQTDMFAPFFRRKRTWLVLVGIAMMSWIIWWMPSQMKSSASNQLDSHQVAIGLGILACIAFLWLSEAMSLAGTALLIPLLATILGVSDIKTALLPFADPLIFMFFGGFALASALSYQKIDLWIAQKIIGWGRGRFLPVAILLFSFTAFQSMWMSNTATTVMMLPIAIGIIHKAQLVGDKNRNAVFLLLGIAYAASIGGLGTIIGTPANGIAAAKLHISFAQWNAIGIPSVLILLPIMIIILKTVCRPVAGLHIEIDDQPFAFNWHRIATLVIFSLTVLSWVFGSWISNRLGIKTSIDTVIALSAVFLLLYFRVVRWRDIDEGTDWGVLILFGGGLSLSEVLSQTGASLYLARMVSSGVSAWPLLAILFAIIAFVIISGELASNTASAALLIPIFYAVSSELGFMPISLVLPIALASSCSFMLPVGTPPNAIVFSTGLVTQRDMLKNGVFLNLACLSVIVIIALILQVILSKS